VAYPHGFSQCALFLRDVVQSWDDDWAAWGRLPDTFHFLELDRQFSTANDDLLQITDAHFGQGWEWLFIGISVWTTCGLLDIRLTISEFVDLFLTCLRDRICKGGLGFDIWRNQNLRLNHRLHHWGETLCTKGRGCLQLVRHILLGYF
jgi:hypothetical protein